MAPNSRNNNSNSHFWTLLILFVAVLFAYRQRNNATIVDAVKDAANQASEAFSSATATNTGSPPYAQQTPRVGSPVVRRQLPQHALAFLARLPGMLLPIIKYPFYLLKLSLPYLTYPLQLVLHALLTVLSPLILLLQETYRILVLLPMHFMLYIGQTLYPFYLFGAVAILFGAGMGSCGGVLHRALVSSTLKPVGDEWKDDVHASVIRVVDGKAGLRQGRQQQRGRRGDEYERHIDPVKEEDLRGWRDSVW